MRGEGFLGEVHACPRCGSMVLIADSPTPSTEAQPTETEPASSAATPTLALGDTLEAIELPESPAPAEPEPISQPAEQSLEEATTSAGGWAPMAVTALALMATCALLGAWWVSGSNDDGPRQEQEAVTVAEPSVAFPGEAEAVVGSEPPPVEPAVEPPLVADEPKAVAAVEEQAVEAERFELPAEPPVEAVAQEPAPSPEPPAGSVDYDEQPPTTIDPLAFDPTEVELVLRRGPPYEAEEPVEPPEPAIAEAPRPVVVPSLDERLAQAGAQAGVSVRRGPTDAASGPPTLSADKALTQVVPAIDLRAIPLDQAVRLLAELSGAPITLDPAALRRAGVRPTKPIDLVAQDQTLGQVLATGLKQARLRYTTDGAQVLTQRLGDDQTREYTHRLGDLVAGDPRALADELARRAPSGLDLPIDSSGELTLTAPGRVHFDLLVASETLRVERGLPNVTKYPRALLTAEPYEAALAATLDRRTTFSFVSPTPLAEVFDHWRRVTERPILIDWPALAAVGVGPRTTLECSVTNRPWRAALDGVLAPLGLAWRADFAGSIWITAAAPGAATAGL